jgi:hypothetical protein
VTEFEDELNRNERKILAGEDEAEQRPAQFGKKWRKVVKVRPHVDLMRCVDRVRGRSSRKRSASETTTRRTRSRSTTSNENASTTTRSNLRMA